MEVENNDFLNEIGGFFERLNLLAQETLPYYRKFAYDVENGVVTDIRQIEHEMDRMLTFCFEDEVLVLYKRVLRKIVTQYPEIVKFYIDAYYDMYEKEDIGWILDLNLRRGVMSKVL